MQEIITQLNQHGFYPQELIPDGKLRRFKRTPQDKHPDAFGVFYENLTQSGEKFYCWYGGDWRENSELTLTTKQKLSSIDKAVLEARIKEAQAKREKELIELREKCKTEVKHIWETAQEFTDTEYTKRKQISGNLGIKVKATDNGKILLVPVKNTKGELVGMQKIFPDGKKLFHPGTAKKGSFHLIGDYINGETYICEGLATGATINMATGKPVVVAFDAGNLVSVAKEIRKTYLDTKIIICGDDDKATKDNPGRTFAEQAAKEALATAVFPDFEIKKENQTDFNDLHVQEGLEKVKNILLGVKAEHHYLKPLGTHGDKFYYISSQGNSVVSLTTSGHNKNNLFNLMPVQYWETVYESKRGVRWDQAFSDLMESCHRVGAFNPEIIRGVGVWEDRGRLLINQGNGLYHDGRQFGLGELETKFIYQAGPRLGSPVKNPLTLSECDQLIKTISHLNWKKDESVFLLCGFVALARFCGALQWRPHLWITGGFGTGKSSIMELLVRPLLGEFSLYFLGNTTEAGMRQSIGYDARPVIFDEFETNDKNTDMRIKACLDLIRQASSESDARIAKGSAGGSAIDYRATFCAIVSSIRVNLTNGADRSRFAVLELNKVEKNAGQWDLVKKQLDLMTPEFAERLFSRVYSKWDILKANRKLLMRALAEKYDMRVGQQYGTLLAGYSVLKYDDVLEAEQVASLVSVLDYTDREDSKTETDETDCLTHIMGSMRRLQTGSTINELTIGEFIDLSSRGSSGLYRAALKQIGIDVDEDGIYIANNHPELSKIFRDTKWASAGWKGSLGRIPGATHCPPRKFGGKLSQRCVRIPHSE